MLILPRAGAEDAIADKLEVQVGQEEQVGLVAW